MSEPLRFELKIPLFDTRPDRALGAIARHPLGFREVYPARWVNNLYIDTLGLDLYFQSLAGVSRRFKLRLRWYGERDAAIDEARLEWKWRESALGFKEVQRVPVNSKASAMSWLALRAAILPSLSPLQRERIASLHWPTVQNRYRRRYFFARCAGVRLTLDEQLEHAALPSIARRSNRGWLHHRRFAVIELKAPATHRHRLLEAVDHFRTRPARYSKYVSAIRYLIGSLDA